nr:hypothetical protein [uncultured Flavobacterium sp.]
MRNFIYLFLIILFISCKKDYSTANNFKFPKVIDTLAVATLYYSPNAIENPENFINKIQKNANISDLRDTIEPYKYFIDDHFLSDTTNKNVVKRNGLKILVDTTTEITIKRIDSNFDLFKNYMWRDKTSPKQKSIDSISYFSVQKFLEKNPKLLKGMPVFIINPASESIRVEVQDWRLMLIQEALDKSGKWRPIEYWEYSGCGNSYGGIALKPNHFILTKIVKYSGNFKTKIRLKFLNDSVVYFSKPFTGSINLSQFDTISVDHKLEKRNFLEPRKPRRLLKEIK